MALKNNSKDIFGLSSLVPPTADDEANIKTETKKDIIPKKEIKKTEPKEKQNKKKVETSFYNVKIKFYDEDDKNFLRYYGGNLGFNQEGFIRFLIKEDIKDKSGIDRKDKLHTLLSSKALIYSGTVRIPESMKLDIKRRAALHGLNQEQYLGFLVRKRRFTTPGWF